MNHFEVISLFWFALIVILSVIGSTAHNVFAAIASH